LTFKIKAVSSVFALITLGSQANANAEDGKGPVFEEIVVTAQKREQSIIDVPIAITALTADQLDKSRAKSLVDMQQLVPNFTFDAVNGFDNISIRGVGGGGRNIGFDSRSGLYIDGVYIGQAAALAQPLFDIERVEVLRGPQGYLFGRNTVSGAVSLVTRAPSENTRGSIKVVAGNEDTYEVYGTAEGPLGENILGKISAAYESRGGFTTNLFNEQKLDDLKRSTVRGQLRFLASEKLTVDVFADYSNTKQKQIVGEPQTDFFDTITPGFPTQARTVNFNTNPRSNNELMGVSMTSNYDFDNGHMLTTVTGYRGAKQTRTNDTDYGPKDLIFIDYLDDSDQFSQEVRLASPDEQSFRYVLGLYYLKETAKTDRLATIGQDTSELVPFVIPGVFVPFAAFGLAPGGVISIDGEVKTSSYAAFGTIDWDIMDQLTLNLGARYTHETKDLIFNLDGAASGGLGIATLPNFLNDRSEDQFKPTLGLTFAANENLNFYAKFSTGFKSGGFNVDFLSPTATTDFTFDTETVESFEVGIKGTAADGRLQFDAAAFKANYNNFQILQFVDLGGGATSIQLRNAAKVKTQGFEASASLYITDNLKVGANVGILDAAFTSFPDAAGIGVNFDGNKLPNAPSFTGAFTLDYHMPVTSLKGSFDIYFEYSHRDSSFTIARNDPNLDNIDARDLVNSRITYSPDEGNWTFSIWAQNLFDEDYLTVHSRDFLGNQFIRRGNPRTWGGEVKINF